MSLPLLDGTARRLDVDLAAVQSRGRLPSVSAGVVRDGELVWTGSRGRTVRRDTDERADADTQYKIGSVSKTMTAALVMLARERGELSLSDPAGRFVPQVPFADATIRSLLAHAVGHLRGAARVVVGAQPRRRRRGAGGRARGRRAGLRDRQPVPLLQPRVRRARARRRGGHRCLLVRRAARAGADAAGTVTHDVPGGGGVRRGLRRAPPHRRADRRAAAGHRCHGARPASCGARSATWPPG